MITQITNDEDLKAVLLEIEQYFDKEPARGTPESVRFDQLANMIEAYEDKHHSIEDSELNRLADESDP